MLIDPFTTVAQIVNFLILVALLKHFLYGPIAKAMEQREQRIATRLQEAATRVEDARREAERYRQKQQELEEQREAFLSLAKQQVEQERQVLLKQMGDEVEAMRAKWYEALQREKQVLLTALRQRLGKQIATTARRILSDLANVSLEQQIVEVFLERLHQLDDAQRQAIRSSVNSSRGQGLMIRTTFAIPPEARHRLIDTIQAQLVDGINVQWEIMPDLLCGIELTTPGYRISWNAAHYLQNLESSLSQFIENGNFNGSQANQSVLNHTKLHSKA